MESAINFSDFKDDYKKLVGHKVLYQYGFTYSEKYSRAIKTIVSTTKTGFRLSDMPEKLFSFLGSEKRLNSLMDAGTISKCKLITEEEANEYIAKFANSKKLYTLKEQIKPLIDTMEDLETAEKIFELLQNTTTDAK